MTCEHCHAPMLEKPPTRQVKDTDEEKVIVFECPQCGRTERQAVIASFWRRLAA